MLLPASSITFKTMLLLPDRVTLVQLIAVLLTMLVMLVQLLPLSTEPYRVSSLDNPADSVPVMVCAAV